MSHCHTKSEKMHFHFKGHCWQLQSKDTIFTYRMHMELYGIWCKAFTGSRGRIVCQLVIFLFFVGKKKQTWTKNISSHKLIKTVFARLCETTGRLTRVSLALSWEKMSHLMRHIHVFRPIATNQRSVPFIVRSVHCCKVLIDCFC